MFNQIEKLNKKIDNFKNSEIYIDLDLIKEKNLLEDLKQRTNSHKFKIGVIGEFSTGKSTLINAIIGKDLLPAKFIPTTNQITYIKGSDSNFIQISGDSTTKKSLSSENIIELSNNSQDRSIDVYLNNHFTNKYTIIDTPGTNDPSRFSDEIVFNLIGSVDVVIFTMKIDSALKQTEIEFISQLIKKKDIEKFFFILNFSDLVDEPFVIKNEVIDKLNNILNLDRDLIKSHTFIISAKKSLEAKLNGNNDELNYTGYNILLENIESYIQNHKMKLLNDMVNLELFNIVKELELKIDSTLDKLNGNDKFYQDQIQILNENINKFKNEIEDEVKEFNVNLKEKKENYKIDIENNFEKIKNEIKSEIKQSALEKFVGTRYLELRTKKLIEDSVADCSDIFKKELEKIVQKFDSSLANVFSDRMVKIDSAVQTNIGKKAVNIIAIAGGGAVGYATYGTVAGVIGSIGASITSVPIIGGYLATALGGIGIAGASVGLFFAIPFLLPIGKILFDTGKWGVEKIGDAAKDAEEKILKEKYILHVNNSIDKVMKQTKENIERIDSKSFIDNYIENKFPQKQVIEKKIKIIEEKKEMQRQLNEVDKSLLISFKESLEESL